MANEFIDDDDNRSETESLLGVKNRGRLKKSWLDDEADEDDDDNDDNITGINLFLIIGGGYVHILILYNP